VNKDMVFPQASAIKIPILIELYRRADAEPALLRARHTLTSATRTGGSGVMGFFADGASEVANEDLAVLMVTLSDNTATNFLIDVVGMEGVNRTMASLGFRETKLQRKMIRPDAQARGEENLSTPAEAATVMARLARCALPLSKSACARVRQVLELPKDESVRATVPESIRVASKPGGMEAVATSWALVDYPGRPFTLAVMTNYGDTEAGNAAIRQIARLALDYYGKLARSTPYGARVPLAVLERERPVRP
jgi:beta-lactamase class A